MPFDQHPVPQLETLDAILDDLTDPTTLEVYRETVEYPPDMIAVSAARRALGGAGGSQAGVAIVRGPFSFAFNTAGLNNGVAFYTPTIGDILLNAWFEVDTAWDGTSPLGDIGTFVGENFGLFNPGNGPVDLTTVSDEGRGAGLVEAYTPLGLFGGAQLQACRVTAANPLKVVVSQSGLKGGTAPGAAQGAARIYIVTATPAAFS